MVIKYQISWRQYCQKQPQLQVGFVKTQTQLQPNLTKLLVGFDEKMAFYHQHIAAVCNKNRNNKYHLWILKRG